LELSGRNFPTFGKLARRVGLFEMIRLPIFGKLMGAGSLSAEALAKEEACWN